MKNNSAQLTRVTSGKRNVRLPDGTTEKTDRVGKQFSIIDGRLAQQTLGSISNGRMDLVEIDNLEELAEVINALETNQCLAYGTTNFESVRLTTQDQWKQLGKPKDFLPRSNETMQWPAGRAILMLDYDPPRDAVGLSRYELVGLVRGLHSELAAADLLHWYSSSSFVSAPGINSGARGQRLYVIVDEGSQINSVGAAIDLNAWAQNLGRIEISGSGALLQRGLFDNSVWQPSRIDYIAGAVLADGVSQDRGNPEILKGSRGGDLIVTNIIDTPDEITSLASVNIARTKEIKQLEAKVVAEVWSGKQLDRLIAKGVDPSHALASINAATTTQTLTAEFELIVHELGGESVVSVQDILNDPKAFHRRKTRDPLEPDYDGGRWVGMIFADGKGICLHSKAHGGTNYWLKQKASAVCEQKKQSPLTPREIVLLREALPWVPNNERTVGRVAQALGAIDNCMPPGLARSFWEWYLVGSNVDPTQFDAHAGQDFAGNSVAFLRFLSWQGALDIKNELEAAKITTDDSATYALAVSYLAAQNQLREATPETGAITYKQGSNYE